MFMENNASEKKTHPRKNKVKFHLRDEKGLVKDVKYVFKENGLIDWRKMVDRQDLYPNLQRTQETDVSRLKDEDLLITLNGLRKLATLRGYTQVNLSVISCSQEFVATVCQISWVGNYETEMLPINFAAAADASLKNTKGFASDFLLAISENRAFARAVRNFLNINICSMEEIKQDKYLDIPGDAIQEVGLDPIAKLKEILTEQNITWEKLKEKLLKEGCLDVKDIPAIDKIPVTMALELIAGYKKT